MEPLACEKIVWRLTRKKHWDKLTGELLPDAYFRRPPDGDKKGDVEGLSVITHDYGDLASFEAAAGLSKTGGVVSLHTGRVRTLGLDIVPNRQDHANITEMPFYRTSRKTPRFIYGDIRLTVFPKTFSLSVCILSRFLITFSYHVFLSRFLITFSYNVFLSRFLITFSGTM